jgi:acyl carrier protein
MTVPSRTEILAKLTAILLDQLGVHFHSEIDDRTRFFADLGLASIDAVVLGEALQNHYDRLLPFNELMADLGRRTDRDLSLGELVDFLQEHLGVTSGDVPQSKLVGPAMEPSPCPESTQAD